MIQLEVTDMQMNEVRKHTGLTKKAVEYYTQKGMISPVVLENGYRDYSEADVEILRKIGILRKLGIGMEEIRKVLQDNTGEVLRKISTQKELENRRNARRASLLRELTDGRDYSEIEEEIEALELEESIAERLLNAFPGYYGRFVGMHFSRFLSEPVRTEEQQRAYETVLDFLDHMPLFEVPEDIEYEMAENTKTLGTEEIQKMLESVRHSMEEPEKFLEENREVVEWYLDYRKSPEYRNSAAGRWMEYMKEFQNTSGYKDVFLPAMKKLSPSYEEYCRQMEKANEKLLNRYPEAGEL